MRLEAAVPHELTQRVHQLEHIHKARRSGVCAFACTVRTDCISECANTMSSCASRLHRASAHMHVKHFRPPAHPGHSWYLQVPDTRGALSVGSIVAKGHPPAASRNGHGPTKASSAAAAAAPRRPGCPAGTARCRQSQRNAVAMARNRNVANPHRRRVPRRCTASHDSMRGRCDGIMLPHH